MSASTDFTDYFQFHSVGAAVFFSVIYIILFGWFVRQSMKNMTYVYIALTVFCLLRIVGFLLRAIVIANKSLHTNENPFVAAEVLFGVGFFALLYSAFTLVLDRELMSTTIDEDGAGLHVFAAQSVSFPLRLLRNRRLFRALLIVAVALTISGILNSLSHDAGRAAVGNDLRRAATVLFLVLTVVQAAQTVVVSTREKAHPIHNANAKRLGDAHAPTILILISLLMLVREIFLTATIQNSMRQNQESLWYPFVALPEVLAVGCYSVSGLVPARKALKMREEALKGQMAGMEMRT
ncbi:hypothetical protein HMN09_00775700 [Mycena chlorophos]|uniref:Uncharacterized protein n=1 Tax=Mycena chlorophos TaxID=658473 RepID=A0A8H6W4C5_MYCCL|nr:hypothetical protein HMN09_00775700 [Mycena chlorophos]